MTMLRPWWRAAYGVLGATLLLATACGPDATTPDATPPDAANPGAAPGGEAGGPGLTVTFDVEGEFTLKGTVEDTVLPAIGGRAPASCADYARGGQSTFVLPLRLGGDLGGRKVLLNVTVRDYAGPGNYTQEKLAGEGTPFGILVDSQPYLAPTGSAGSIVNTDAKGGGSFYFENLSNSNDGPSGEGLAGMVSWTCHD